MRNNGGEGTWPLWSPNQEGKEAVKVNLSPHYGKEGLGSWTTLVTGEEHARVKRQLQEAVEVGDEFIVLARNLLDAVEEKNKGWREEILYEMSRLLEQTDLGYPE